MFLFLKSSILFRVLYPSRPTTAHHSFIPSRRNIYSPSSSFWWHSWKMKGRFRQVNQPGFVACFLCFVNLALSITASPFKILGGLNLHPRTARLSISNTQPANPQTRTRWRPPAREANCGVELERIARRSPRNNKHTHPSHSVEELLELKHELLAMWPITERSAFWF